MPLATPYIAYGGGALIFLSLIYEPVRLLLAHVFVDLLSDVGGVGGVGGLTNQWFCPPITAFNRTTNFSTAPYCFHHGVLLGLTPFAIVVLVFWSVLALLVPALFVALKSPETEGMNTTVRVD